MKTYFILILGILISLGCARNNKLKEYSVADLEDLVILPDVIDSKPDVESPILAGDQREFVLAGFENGKYSWLDVTVENGETFNYKQNLHGKGNQLLPDEIDFPHFAQHGLHSDKELSRTVSITGRSVAQITVDGRPWASSGVGFMADDETILSVIWGDNKIVKKLGLTHPDLARPLFHVWNTRWMMGHLKSEYKLKNLSYNNKMLSLNLTGSRGWQESIFDDEILGTGHMEIRGEISEDDLEFIDSNYSSLLEEELVVLKNKLSFIHTGELVLFYISRYGFYEGHIEYRPDPLAIAYVFGLKSIKEIHQAAGGDLHTYFTTHFTETPKFQESRFRTQDSRVSNKTQDLRNRTNENPQPTTRNPQLTTRNN